MNVVKKLISYPKVDLNQGVTKIGATQLLIAADKCDKDFLLHPKTIFNLADWWGRRQ